MFVAFPPEISPQPDVPSVAAVAPPDAVRRSAGAGRVGFALVAGRTAVVSRFATSPLKLLTPRGSGKAATVVTSTYGGGLVAGDRVTLEVRCGADTRCVLGTQASTKVYRQGPCHDAPVTRQELNVTLEARAACVVAPDPVTCFDGAAYRQVQRFDLAATSSLLLIDWLTSGRAARGERWAFASYRTETVIEVGGGTLARDAMLLDPSDGPVAAPHRMGRFDCIATVFVAGPLFAWAADRLRDRVESIPVRRREAMVAAVSPLADGALLRVAGGSAEQVGRFLRAQLTESFEAFGTHPWSRKW